MAQIVIFTRPNCVYCDKAKDLLLSYGAQLWQVVLDEQEDYAAAREEMVRRCSGATTVPQLFINGVHVEGGFTALKALHEAGVIASMITTWQPQKLDTKLTMRRVVAVPKELDF